MTEENVSPRRGPRRGEDTRGAILAAARSEFAEKGYDAASLRGIARAAGVDPALVHHYFDGKTDLFAQAVVQVSPSVQPLQVVARITQGPPDEVGERLVLTIVGLWDSQVEVFVALLRSISSSEQVARGAREFVSDVIGQVARTVDPQASESEIAQRVALVLSQMFGLAMARYVAQIPQIADAEPEELAAHVAPVIQGYLLPR